MTNRTDEYWELIGELAQPPKKLEGSVQRARKRARRAQFARKLITPAATLAAAAACFVLMVNTFPTFALACSGVPIIRELTAAVAFSSSLSAAVAHDYVQYIGQSQTVDGVTVSLEYAIVDQHESVFFYSVDGARFYTSPNLTDANGNGITGYGVDYNEFDGQKADRESLNSVTFSFIDGSLPERFTMEMFFMPESEPEQAASAAYAPAAPETSVSSVDSDLWRDPREDPGVLRFTFDVTLDAGRIVQPVIMPVDRMVELDGQRILVDRLECTPTRTVLYLDEDTANTAWLIMLKFWFEDETGARYDDIDGSLLASGQESYTGSKSMLTYYFQSFYYDQPKELTLCIDKAQWLDKDAPHAYVDLTTGESSGLPDDAAVGGITRTGKNVTVEFLFPTSHQGFAQSFAGTYWDPEGGEHTWNQWSGGSRFDDGNEPSAAYEKIYLNGYPWDTVELELSYTSISEYEQPVRIPLRPQS